MENDPAQTSPSLGYEFAREEEARTAASNLDRRFTETELSGLRIYRVRWNGNFLVEATFSQGTPEARLHDARALLGESGTPYTPTTSKTTNAPRNKPAPYHPGCVASSDESSCLRPTLSARSGFASACQHGAWRRLISTLVLTPSLVGPLRPKGLAVS